MPQITGVVRITIDGELLESLPDAELDLGGDSTKSVMGHKRYGHTVEVMPSKLTCTIVWKSITPLEKLRGLIDGTAIFESDAGMSYTVDNCTLTKPPVLKGGSGEVPLEFEGDPAKEM